MAHGTYKQVPCIKLSHREMRAAEETFDIRDYATAWRVLKSRTEEIWRIAANILYKQSRSADSGWLSSLGVGRGANNLP